MTKLPAYIKNSNIEVPQFILDSDLLSSALFVAAKMHEGQYRKFDGSHYIVHPLEVCTLVREYTNDELTLAAALLHDVVEDTDYTVADVELVFGSTVALLTSALTDESATIPEMKTLPRKDRKAHDRNRLADFDDYRVHTVKLCDIVSNTRDWEHMEPKYRKLYFTEKKALVTALTAGDEALRSRLFEHFETVEY